MTPNGANSSYEPPLWNAQKEFLAWAYRRQLRMRKWKILISLAFLFVFDIFYSRKKACRGRNKSYEPLLENAHKKNSSHGPVDDNCTCARKKCWFLLRSYSSVIFFYSKKRLVRVEIEATNLWFETSRAENSPHGHTNVRQRRLRMRKLKTDNSACIFTRIPTFQTMRKCVWGRKR